MIRKSVAFHIIKAFVMLMRYMVLFPLLGPELQPVAYVSFSRLSTRDFKDPLEAIMKDSLGRGWQCFLPQFPRLFCSYSLKAS